ncbi:MAG: hypothetical protein HY303_13795 [Candidatus Wallbacteria bacterium]|nr:hypothetical protein [Candidatus Wallbacteria bacterium]
MTRYQWVETFKRSLVLASALAILVIAHPLLPAAPLAARWLFLAVVLGAATGVVLSPAYRRWLRPRDASTYKGLRLPEREMLHAGHAWVRDEEGALTVGADDLVTRVLGSPDSVELPRYKSRVLEGEPLFTLKRGDRSVTVRAPAAGLVVGTNEALMKNPRLLRQAPYGAGWAVRLAESPDRRPLDLLDGQDARDWFKAEADRMLGSVHPDLGPNGLMSDGGALVEDFHLHVDEVAWGRLAPALFGGHVRAATWPAAGLRHHGGDLVGRGDYLSFHDGEYVHSDGCQVLPGAASKIYYQLHPLAFTVMSPLAGLAYAVLLPFVGLAMVAVLAVEALATNIARFAKR